VLTARLLCGLPRVGSEARAKKNIVIAVNGADRRRAG
jgi:hypothetical protein